MVFSWARPSWEPGPGSNTATQGLRDSAPGGTGRQSEWRDEEMQKELALYVKSMGKVFRITEIAGDVDSANRFCEAHPDSGVIAQDTEAGLIFIANKYAARCKSTDILD